MITADILGERARLTPDSVALVYVPTGERFTYRELDALSARIADGWLALGFAKGDRVAILARSRPEYIAAFFAAAKTGIILVPLNSRLTAHELEFVVLDAGCRALVYDSSCIETVVALRRGRLLDSWLDLDAPAAAATNPAPSQVEAENPCSPEDPLCLLYTSGTTGKPKGVIIPHRMVAWNAYNTLASWQLRDTDISPLFTPLYHAGGLAVSLTATFLIGGTVVLHEHFDAAEVLRTVAAERCTIMFGVPTIFKLLMDSPEFASTDLSSLRWCISGGAPLPAYMQQAWQQRGITFKQGYGLTEVGVNCFAMTAEDSLRKPGSIGKPMLFTEARIVCSTSDAVTSESSLRQVAPQNSNFREADIDEVGELWLRGPHVCRGYWNNPDATAAALDADGWFHTGDLARRDAEGFFYIAGRAKDMIISGGVNIYPIEIEAELLQHPAVRDAAVIGVPHETWGEVGIAYIVLRYDVAADDLAQFLASRLGKYKIPKGFVFIDELPRTAYGKVLKPELRKLWENRSPSAMSRI